MSEPNAPAPARRVVKRKPAPQPAKDERSIVDPDQHPSGQKLEITLQGRHHEWLCRVAKLEGRTPAGMADRLIRLAYSQDSTKGGLFASGKGTANSAGQGVTSTHPARQIGT